MDIVTGTRGRLARIELNRPRAINALSLPMVAAVKAVLEHWRVDDGVAAVLLTGAGERGLCAGGDIKAIHALLGKDEEGILDFWRTEYAMNLLIAEYPKPYIAIMNGITMGGGLGVSAHGSHRIVTESSRLAMPETGIGLFPDVGITHLFARMDPGIGAYLALTGQSIGAGAAIRYGLADYLILDQDLPALIAGLERRPEAPDEVLSSFSQPAPDDELEPDREWISRAFSLPSVEAIIAELRRLGPDAEACASQLETRSPTSLKVTLAAIRAAARQDLAATLRQDLRIAGALTRLPDLAEGIRAQVIDKDRNPLWQPPSLELVDDHEIARIIDEESEATSA